MPYTRRELLQKVFSPARGRRAGPESTGPALPPEQDICLRTDRCIAWGRGLCDRCADVCAPDAILFVGMMHPRILSDRCTLCADCVAVCPTDAIAVRRPPSARTGETP